MSKNLRSSFIIFQTILLFVSCSKKYYGPNANQIADSHQIIAIIPPSVNLYPRNYKNAVRESINYQQRLYSWMISRRTQNHISIGILKIAETNDLLEEAGYFDGNDLTPIKICEILKVDGILTSEYSSSNSLSDAESLTIGTVLGMANGTPRASGPPPGKVNSTLEIYDGKTGEMIWSYKQKKSVYITGPSRSSSSSNTTVDKMMNAASKNMPYFRQ